MPDPEPAGRYRAAHPDSPLSRPSHGPRIRWAAGRRHAVGVGPALLLAVVAAVAPAGRGLAAPATTTPIHHLMVIIGENRSFDHVFATYRPRPGERVANMLAKGIIMADGSPGPEFAAAAQAEVTEPQPFAIAPGPKQLYDRLPPTRIAVPAPDGSGGGGGPLRLDLANGPFPLTPGVAYGAYTANPVHRFYQNWQQADCAVAHATWANPSGCRADLYAWVAVTVGAGRSGKPPPVDLAHWAARQGANALGFYNMAAGDAPYLKALADRYTLADNYHQPVMGGSGTNHIALGYGDLAWYADAQGRPARPPENQIEDPEPLDGTLNWYRQDGSSGGSYSACADRTQPGVAAIRDYLAALPYHPDPGCEPGTYYLLNNFTPAFLGDGRHKPGALVVPPLPLPSIGDLLTEHGVTWRYYGQGWNHYLQAPEDYRSHQYCDLCNPFQYSATIMADAAARARHLADIDGLMQDLASDNLPAVTFVKPDGRNDGHPASSTLDRFEAFSRTIIEAVQARPVLWRDTAILVIFDEAGGYWDSGYIQPLDFFGDGPRVPLIAVSPFAEGGRVVHGYGDHVSILKFIERNWRLPPLSGRSRDNLPNPRPNPDNPYVPANPPAISDLTDLFRFPPPGRLPLR